MRPASQHILQDGPKKVGMSRGAYQRVHYKNTRETAAAVSGMKLQKVYPYLEDVLEHKRAIPFRVHKGGVGRTAQGKEFGVTQARWPVKSVKFIMKLIKEAESNASNNGLDPEDLVVRTIVVNQAPKMRRRTYRAHGRVNAYLSSPCHIEVIVGPSASNVPKGDLSAPAAKEAEPKAIEA